MASSIDRSVLLIEELDDNREALRSIELHGSAMPVWGAQWRTETTIVTEFYPGNAVEGDQQVLGPKEMPSTWTGDWRINQLVSDPSLFTDSDGTPTSVTSPQLLRDIFDSFRANSRRLRVSFIATNEANPAGTGSIVREGRLQAFQFALTDLTLLEWEAKFDWVGRGGVLQKVVATRADNVPSAAAALAVAADAMLTAIAATELANAAISPPANKLTLGRLEAIAALPTSYASALQTSASHVLSDVQQVGTLLTTLKNSPLSIVNSGTAIAKQAIEVCQQFIDDVSRTPSELLTTKSNVADILHAANDFHTVSDSAVVVARKAQEMDAKIRQQSKAAGLSSKAGMKVHVQGSTQVQEILAIHVVKSGETPDAISQRYYQTIDHAVDIMRANKLPMHIVILKPGSILIIPRLSSLKSA